jgi:hypothetical protein
MANPIYTNMPFTLEARINDPDSFPSPVLEWAWSTITQPVNSNIYFLNSTSITPNILVDTAGSYVVELVVFDGEAITSATFSFQAIQSYAASEFLSGSCLGLGSGANPNTSVIYASATDVISQVDANAKAAASAANSLQAVLNCCPASFKVGIPSDAPSGSSYAVYIVPADEFPKEDYGVDFYNSSFSSGSGYGSGIYPITSLNTPYIIPGSYTESILSVPVSVLNANQSVSFIITVEELSPLSVLTEVSDFNVAIAPVTPNGNTTGITVAKRQRNATNFAVQQDRALCYQINVPQPFYSRFSATIQNVVPPLPVWQVNAAGYDLTATWGGNTANALGLFLLTGGTLAVPTSEVLIMGMNSSTTDLNLCASYYDFFGFSQIPYQGSLYSSVYSDRRAFAPIPRTGFVGTTPSTIVSWAQALMNYVNLNAINPLYNVYFRAGNWNGFTYTWFPSSVPLYLERSSGITIGSLVANGAILAAANSVLIISNTTTSTCFATVQGTPSLYLDMYRFNTLFPTATTLGVYNSSSGAHIISITPNVPAGRGYDITNLAQNTTIQNLLKTATATPFSLAFNLETVPGTPIANSFPLTIKNLTTYTSAYSVSTNILTISNTGVKLYIANLNG